MGRKRTTIGLIYNPSSSWIAGAYYVQNIISALTMCDDKHLPIIKVYCSSPAVFDELKTITMYPYLRMRIIENKQLSIWIKRFRRRLEKYLKIDFPTDDAIARKTAKDKFVYPIHWLSEVVDKTKALGWIPDFQEKYLQSFFSEEELVSRNEWQKDYIKNNVPVVFSSEDSRFDFYKFHPEGKDLKTFVLPFAVTHPDFTKTNIDVIKRKYSINKPYLFCANQFWIHKNHLFLFKAFKSAKEKGFDVQLVCSGKISDYRDKEYGQTLLSYIKKEHLENDILLLGFIDRKEQLCLMKNSYAIVQPSLFEGWSTVVEDAKSLNKFIFLSNLRVHIEQNPKNASYFNPYDEEDLVEKLLNVEPTQNLYDYQQDIKKFGERFIEIINAF